MGGLSLPKEVFKEEVLVDISTSIPEEIFTPVDIPRGGGETDTRAFYLTMTSINLVHKTASGDTSDSAIVGETSDIEIWDGEFRYGCIQVFASYH